MRRKLTRLGASVGFVAIKQTSDFFEREAQGLCALDEPHPPGRIGGVAAMTVLRLVRAIKPRMLIVVANRPDVDAGHRRGGAGQGNDRRGLSGERSQVTTTTPVLKSVLTCPHCGHGKQETMPTDACRFFYECGQCKGLVRPKAGDCCVYCSHGSVKCPPLQIQGGCSSCST